MDEIVLDGITYECPAQTKQAISKVILDSQKLKRQVEVIQDAADKSKEELEDMENDEDDY